MQEARLWLVVRRPEGTARKAGSMTLRISPQHNSSWTDGRTLSAAQTSTNPCWPVGRALAAHGYQSRRHHRRRRPSRTQKRIGPPPARSTASDAAAAAPPRRSGRRRRCVGGRQVQCVSAGFANAFRECRGNRQICPRPQCSRPPLRLELAWRSFPISASKEATPDRILPLTVAARDRERRSISRHDLTWMDHSGAALFVFAIASPSFLVGGGEL